MNLSFQKTCLAITVLCSLWAQTLTLAHTTEHAFHGHEEECERFETIENSPVLEVSSLVILLAPQEAQDIAFIENASFLNSKKNYRIRAPPISSRL